MPKLAITQYATGAVLSLLEAPDDAVYSMSVFTTDESEIIISSLTRISWQLPVVADTIVRVVVEDNTTDSTIVIDQKVLLDGNALALLSTLRTTFTPRTGTVFKLMQALHLSAHACFELDKVTSCQRILDWIASYDTLYCEDC